MSDLIAEFVRHLRDEGYATSTAELYEATLRRMDRQLPMGLCSANTDELRAWIDTGDQRRISPAPRSPGTRALFGAITRSFFRWATDPTDPRLSFDSAALLPRVRVRKGLPRPLAPEVVDDILARAPEPYRTWFVLARWTGARCCELAELDRGHVTEDRVLLHGKGDKLRYVPTDPQVWQLAQAAPPGLLVVGAHGEPLTRKQVSQRGNRVLQLVLGYPATSMHMLRHTFGTEAYAARRDIRATQKLLGHASIATTERYVDVGWDALEASVRGQRAA